MTISPRYDSEAEETLTVMEAADRLGLSPRSGYLNRLIRAGELPATKHGQKSYRIRKSDLARLTGDQITSGRKGGLADGAARRQKKWLTVKEAARRLAVTPERIYQLLTLGAAEGGLEGRQKGSMWEIAPLAVAEHRARRNGQGRPVVDTPEWISQSIAAELYGRACGRRVSRQAVGEMVRTGKLKVKKIDGIRCVNRGEVIALTKTAR